MNELLRQSVKAANEEGTSSFVEGIGGLGGLGDYVKYIKCHVQALFENRNL